MSLVEQMADKAPLWQKLVVRDGLRDTPWDRLAAWPFVDGWLNMGYDMVQSTIKIRRAGFSGCIDTRDGLFAALKRIREQKIVP
jgi:hypothetical protein